MTQHLPILPILAYMFAALLMPIAGMVNQRLPWLLASLTSAIVTALGGAALWLTAQEGAIRYAVANWQAPIGIELVADPLSSFFTFTLGIVSAVVLLHSKGPVERDCGHGSNVTYYASAMLLLGGFAGIVGTGDLFNLYVFLEISSLAGYALLGVGSPRAAVSAFRYLIIGTIGASFYLIGLGFLLVNTGSLNMADVAGILAADGLNQPTTLGIVFLVGGLGVKMALLPLHQWLPDVYTTAPASSTALIAPLGTKVAAYAILRICYEVLPFKVLNLELHLMDVIAALGAVGIVWGSVMAIPQDNMKRMLAYSSIAQIGYIALGIGLATPYGYIGAVLHVINHAFMKSCLFLVTANLESSGRSVSIKELDPSFRRQMPLTAACFTMAAISMIGLPPMAGFFSKWYLLLGSYQEEAWIYVGVIVLSSLLNAVYFFRIIERLYLGKEEKSESEAPRQRFSILLSGPTLFLALALVALGLGNVFIVSRFITPMLPGI